MKVILIAQTVSHVTAEQVGSSIRIHYTLLTDLPASISVFLSEDSGVTWQGPLTAVQGDIGLNITSGEKHILWNVLSEREHLLGEFKFKVSAQSMTRTQSLLEMIKVPGGTYLMGSAEAGSDALPQHLVELSTFFIGKYEVTQAQWKAVMKEIPVQTTVCDDCPVESISWNECQNFLRQLNAMTGLSFRLPTEAEWEYAAIGGNKSRGYTYAGSDDLSEVAWHTLNSDNHTHAVGQKKPNELGIFDMSGNVWEWCNDYYGAYKAGSVRNPNGPAQGQSRIRRGGAYYLGDHALTVRHRSRREPEENRAYYGFRIALTAGQIENANVDLAKISAEGSVVDSSQQDGGGSGGGGGSRAVVYKPDCGNDAEEEGWVVVRVTLRADGSVQAARAVDSSEFSDVAKFRQRAENCAKGYKFNAGSAGQTVKIKILFRMR